MCEGTIHLRIADTVMHIRIIIKLPVHIIQSFVKMCLCFGKRNKLIFSKMRVVATCMVFAVGSRTMSQLLLTSALVTSVWNWCVNLPEITMCG